MSEKKKLNEKFGKASISIARAGDDILTFSDSNVVKIKILSAIDDTANINGKIKQVYKMKVINLLDDKEINFNPASSRLRESLSRINEEEGLINQKLRIEKVGSGMGTKYLVSKIE